MMFCPVLPRSKLKWGCWNSLNSPQLPIEFYSKGIHPSRVWSTFNESIHFNQLSWFICIPSTAICNRSPGSKQHVPKLLSSCESIKMLFLWRCKISVKQQKNRIQFVEQYRSYVDSFAMQRYRCLAKREKLKNILLRRKNCVFSTENKMYF